MGDHTGKACTDYHQCGDGPYLQRLRMTFSSTMADSSSANANSTSGILCSYPGLADHIPHAASVAALVPFLTETVAGAGFDGLYLDNRLSSILFQESNVSPTLSLLAAVHAQAPLCLVLPSVTGGTAVAVAVPGAQHLLREKTASTPACTLKYPHMTLLVLHEQVLAKFSGPGGAFIGGQQLSKAAAAATYAALPLHPLRTTVDPFSHPTFTAARLASECWCAWYGYWTYRAPLPRPSRPYR